MNRRRVLFVDQSGDLGGAELSLFDLVVGTSHDASVVLFNDGPFREMLQRAGVSVEVLALPAKAKVGKKNSAMKLARSIPFFASFTLRLRKRAAKFELLYANTQKAFVLSAVACLATRRPLIWHLRDILTKEHFSPALIRLVVVLANSCATRIVANSRATADAFIKAGGRQSLVEVAYNGFNTADYIFDRETCKAELCRICGIPASCSVIGVFSRLARWKGQHTVIEALAALPNTHLIVVGSPFFDENEYAESLYRQAQDPKVAGRVHFLGFRSDVIKLMASVDIAVHSSIAAEPFGRVIAEAMLAGTPVVATAAGGALELVTDRRTGRLFPMGNSGALNAVLAELLIDTPQMKFLAANAKAWATENLEMRAAIVKLDSRCDL